MFALHLLNRPSKQPEKYPTSLLMSMNNLQDCLSNASHPKTDHLNSTHLHR